MIIEFQDRLTTAILSCPIVYIPHFHYQFIDESIREIVSPGQEARCVVDGLKLDNVIEFDAGSAHVLKFDNKTTDSAYSEYDDALGVLQMFCKPVNARDSILLLKNFTSHLHDSQIQSLLAMYASRYENGEIDRLSTIIIASPLPVNDLPREIEKFVTVIDIKAPNQDEIMALLRLYDISTRHVNDEEALRFDLCRTLQGLQYYEIKQILDSALIRTGGKISEVTKRLALEEKKNIVRKSGIIEVVDADESFEQIGGLETLKSDLLRKASIYKNLTMAQKSRVPVPKGVLIIGMPGCGKTMIAKAVASEFGVSLLRLDVNRLMGKYVGESEGNLRLALATAEAAHPCILWIDEIEKAFAGTSGPGSDMLVMRLMGHFLTWMQERRTPVFIVATANDVMRPEFMRKGRFDEVYFVDFPEEKERAKILESMLRPYRATTAGKSIFDFSPITNVTELVKDMKGLYGGFSGAEIRSVLNMVLEEKFLEYTETRIKHPNLKKVKVEKKDFDKAINTIKDSVMANQSSTEYQEYQKNKNQPRQEYLWTNIERIKAMWEKYKFKPASEQPIDKNKASK